jgi:hypothetical protein
VSVGGLEINVSASRIQALVDMLQAGDREAVAAFKSTLGKMASWVRTKSLRDLSGKLKLQQNILRKRLRTYRFMGGSTAMRMGEVKVWYGLNDIPYSRLKPVQRGNGVAAMGGRFIKDAFIAELRGHPEVLKREGRERLPIKVQYERIADKATTYIEDFVLVSEEFERQFFKIFEHELRWRMQILK